MTRRWQIIVEWKNAQICQLFSKQIIFTLAIKHLLILGHADFEDHLNDTLKTFGKHCQHIIGIL